MTKKNISRRNFLKQFALLSSAPLITYNLAGCAEYGPDPGPVYGPPPFDNRAPRVQGLYIHDPQDGNGLLDEATDVPVDASFEIEFTKEMMQTSVEAVHLQADDIEVPFEGSWLTPKILLITPDSNLENVTRYTLTVDEDAIDIYNISIELTAESQAAFETV